MKGIASMTDKNNSGFGAGFLGDVLKDLQKEYLGTGPGKSKGKKKKTPSKAKQTKKEPEFAEVPSAVHITDYHPGDLIMDTYHVESEAIRGGMEAQTEAAAGVILLNIYWSPRIPNTERH